MANKTFNWIANDQTVIPLLAVDLGGGTSYALATRQVDSAGSAVGGGSGKNFEIAPAVTAGAYAAGNSVGIPTQLASVNSASGRPVKLSSLLVRWKANSGVTPPVTWLFFNANPTNSTFTDKSAATLHVNDLTKLVGAVKVVAGDYLYPISGGPTYAVLGGIEQLMLPATTDLWVVGVADGAFTPLATTDLSLHLGFEQK